MKNPGLRHPGRWFWLLLLVPVVIGLTRLRFDVEVFDLLPKNLPAVEGLKLYQERFAHARELLITVQAAEAQQVESAAPVSFLRTGTHTVLQRQHAVCHTLKKRN